VSRAISGTNIVRLALTPHPASPRSAVSRIEAEIARPAPGQMTLSFTLTGNIAEIVLPPVSAPARRPELWTRTCFEAFLRASNEPGYYELNLSASTEWAVYRFDGYRSGMQEASEIGAVPIDWRSDEDSYTLVAGLNADPLPGLAHARSWRIGLAAVIEERSGSRSYWSLVHPADKPDFHHPASFSHELMSRERT